MAENEPSSSDPVEDITVSDASESSSESIKDAVKDEKNDKVPKKKESVSRAQKAVEEVIPKGPEKIDPPSSTEQKSIPAKDSPRELESSTAVQKPIIKELQPKAVVQDISPQPKQATISSKEELANVADAPKTVDKLEPKKDGNKPLESTVAAKSIKKEDPKATIQNALPQPQQAVISSKEELEKQSESVKVPDAPEAAAKLVPKKDSSIKQPIEQPKATIQDALPKPKQAVISSKDELKQQPESVNVPEAPKAAEQLESSKALESTALKKSIKKEQPKVTVQDVSPQPKQAVISKNVESAQKSKSDNEPDTPGKVTSNDSRKTSVVEKSIVQEQPKVTIQDVSKKPNQAVITMDGALPQKPSDNLVELTNDQIKIDAKPEKKATEKSLSGENKNLLSTKSLKSLDESRNREVSVEQIKDDKTTLKPVTRPNADSKKTLKPIQVHCPNKADTFSTFYCHAFEFIINFNINYMFGNSSFTAVL